MKINVLWLILLAGLATGASTVSGRVGVLAMSPFLFLFLRYCGASIGFLILFSFTSRPTLPKNDSVWKNMVLVGVGTVLSQLLFALASQQLSSGVVSLFVALIPIFITLLAPFIAKEQVNKKSIAGLSLAFSGVLLILLTRTNGLATNSSLISFIQGLLGAIIYAFTGLYMRRTLRAENVSLVTSMQMLTAALLLLPATLYLGVLNLTLISWQGWLSILFSGLVGSLGAFWLITYITKYYGATKAALQTYVGPIVATILGVILLRETTSTLFIVALILVLSGLIVSTYGTTKK